MIVAEMKKFTFTSVAGRRNWIREFERLSILDYPVVIFQEDSVEVFTRTLLENILIVIRILLRYASFYLQNVAI